MGLKDKIYHSLSDRTAFIMFVVILFAFTIFGALILKTESCQVGFPFIYYGASSVIAENGGTISQSFDVLPFVLNLVIIYIIAVIISFLSKL